MREQVFCNRELGFFRKPLFWLKSSVAVYEIYNTRHTSQSFLALDQLVSGADLGGGGRTPLSGIRTPANPKGPPFGTF